MLRTLRTLLLVSALCARSSTLCLHLYRPGSDVLCDSGRNGDPRGSVRAPKYSPVADNNWGSLFRRSSEFLSSSAESRERRTSVVGQPNYRILSQTKLRGKILQNSAMRSDRRSKFTLSLDVPTNIMNILFDMAKAKNLRAKAADNARLLAHIG